MQAAQLRLILFLTKCASNKQSNIARFSIFFRPLYIGGDKNIGEELGDKLNNLYCAACDAIMKHVG